MEHPDVVPLIAEPMEAGLRAFDARGHYPINHLIVVRDDVLAENPGIAAAVFHAFAASKRLYLEALAAGRIAEPSAADAMHLRVMQRVSDPLPYGVAANRRMLETLIGHAAAQGILRRPARIEHLFARETLELEG